MSALQWLGQAWALPISLAGVLVAYFGGARPLRREGPCFFWVARPGGLAASFFAASGMAAFTWGAVLVFREAGHLRDRRLVRHEMRHTQQAFWLGPLMPLAYGACALWAWVRGGHPYHDNALEADARRAEGAT